MSETLFVVMIYVMGIVPPLVIVASRVYYFITEERKSERESIDHRIDVAIEARKRVVSRKKIPAAIQEEIDQTPEWWDREFRRLSGEPEPPRILTSPGGIGYIPVVNGDARIGKAYNPVTGIWTPKRTDNYDIAPDLARHAELVTDLPPSGKEWGRVLEQRLIDLQEMKVRTYSPGGWIDPAPPTPAELVTEDVIYATLEPEKKSPPDWLNGGTKHE